AAAAVLCIAPLFGGASIDVGAIGDATTVDGRIFWQIRVPRVLLAMLAGAALAAAGAGFQALLRNPLATPYTLGIAGGASLGAVSVLLLGLATPIAGFSPLPIAAFGGAFGSVLAVYALARAIGRANTADLLLAGIAWSMVSAACVLLLQYLADPAAAYQMIRWLVGGLEVVGFASPIRALPFAVLGLAVLSWHAADLNLLAVDESLAAAR